MRGRLMHSGWDETGPVTVRMAWAVEPPPDPVHLRRATRRGLRAARRALPSRGRVRVQGRTGVVGARQVVEVTLHAYGVPADDPMLAATQAAFVRAFEDAMRGERRLQGIPDHLPALPDRPPSWWRRLLGRA